MIPVWEVGTNHNLLYAYEEISNSGRFTMTELFDFVSEQTALYKEHEVRFTRECRNRDVQLWGESSLSWGEDQDEAHAKALADENLKHTMKWIRNDVTTCDR